MFNRTILFKLIVVLELSMILELIVVLESRFFILYLRVEFSTKVILRYRLIIIDRLSDDVFLRKSSDRDLMMFLHLFKLLLSFFFRGKDAELSHSMMRLGIQIIIRQFTSIFLWNW